MEKAFHHEFPKAKSGYKIMERYAYENDPSFIYSTCFHGEENHHHTLTIHQDLSHCVTRVLEFIADNELNHGICVIERWKNGAKVDAITIG